MTCKRIINGGIASLAFLSFFVACMSVQTLSMSSESQDEGSIEFNFSTLAIDYPGDYMTEKGMDIAFYLFDPISTNFLQNLLVEQTNSTETSVTYQSSPITYGDYNLVIVAKDENSGLESPTTKSSLMYAMSESVTSCPEIFYVSQNVTIDESTVTTSVTMDRNLSKVWIRVDDSNGVLDNSQNVTVSLSGVPSNLSWEGKFMSNNGSLETVKLPSQTDALTTDANLGYYATDDMEYIIPAHRGDDVPSYELTITLEATDTHGQTLRRTATIDDVIYQLPQLNGIIRYKLIPKSAELEIEVETLPWDVEDVHEDLTDDATSELKCMVIEANGKGEAEIMRVYYEWNVEGGYFYDPSNPMDQTKTVYPHVVSDVDGVIKDVSIYNRTSSIPYSVLVVETTGNTGEATVGIKLEDDNFSTPNGGYRWKWHVIVTETGSTTSCSDNSHPYGVNTTN